MGESEAKGNGPASHKEHHHPDEREIDEALKESFPASDPPSWTLGIDADENEPSKSGPEDAG